MRYRYLDDFRRGISVFAIFSYGIAVLGTPQCPPLFIFKPAIELPLTTRQQIMLTVWLKNIKLGVKMEIQYNIDRQLHNPIVMQSQKETWFVGS